jgi:hypothetical protein
LTRLPPATSLQLLRCKRSVRSRTHLRLLLGCSHSLLALVIWGLLLAWGYRLLAGNGPRAFLVISGLVVSHWVLDVLTHRPDMPLYPNGPKFGLGLWNFVGLTIAIEMAMFGVGAWLYLRATRARDKAGLAAVENGDHLAGSCPAKRRRTHHTSPPYLSLMRRPVF